MRALPFLLLACVASRGAELRAGAAAVDITPPAGAPLAGYYYNRAATGVHDRLYARALVLESGGARAALVACDLIHLTRPVVDEARRLIQLKPGIAPASVMISATHAHTGPVILDDSARYNLDGEMRRIAVEYARGLPALIAAAVRQAGSALRPVTISQGAGSEPSLAFNRRYYMKDGSVGWNPGKNNPNIVRPAGPVDPEAAVLAVNGVDGKPIATYVNYALHLDTTGGLEISADYPATLGAITSAVRAGALPMFTIGCAGNINHLDFFDPRPQRGPQEAARIGTVLAGEVVKTLARLSPADPAFLSASSRTVNLPPAAHRPEDVAWARSVAAKFGAPNAAPFLDQVKAFRVLDVERLGGKPLPAEVQVVALGRDLAWVGLPGEIFVELGLAIKRASPFPRTIVVELANGNIGYVPDRGAYAGGNYEVISSRCAEGGGELLADAALRLLEEAYRWNPSR